MANDGKGRLVRRVFGRKTRMTELPADVLRCQVDSLRDALLKVLDTREKDAEASDAEKEARLLLATLKNADPPGVES